MPRVSPSKILSSSLLFSMAFVGLSACQYQDSRVNINFADLNLEDIQKTMDGRWRVHYINGGLIVGHEYRENLFIVFSHGRIRSELEGSTVIDDSIMWFNSEYLGDPTWTMEFNQHYLLPYGIFNDTLRLVEPYINGPVMHLTKVR